MEWTGVTREGVVGLVGWWGVAGLLLALHLRPLAVVSFGMGLLWAGFCRHPRRTPAEPDAAAWVAPADGKVVEVTALPNGRTRVGIFMRVWDVHVNRAPQDAEVVAVLHRRGGYRPAFREAAVRDNEQVHWTLQGRAGRFEMVQIAGILARRIRVWVRPGQWVRRGTPLGMILLGSRVDLYLPAGVEPRVTPGARVRAGETVVARRLQ